MAKPAKKSAFGGTGTGTRWQFIAKVTLICRPLGPGGSEQKSRSRAEPTGP
jgi:hypothetical protein